jgi:colanic acid biosynthesis glycosyl transferase WcaI
MVSTASLPVPQDATSVAKSGIPRPSVLFLNRSYWPDVEATGQLLTELCEDLADSFDIMVIAGQPNQNLDGVEFRRTGWQSRSGVRIRRVWHSRFPKSNFFGRAINYLSFLFAASIAAFRAPRADIIIAETDPPLLCLLAGMLRRWHGAKLVIYLQDIYPDLAVALGKLPSNWMTKLLRRVMFRVYKRADRVVILSRDMQELLESSGVSTERIRCVPNWIDTTLVFPDKVDNDFRREQLVDEKFVVMYSGNLGLCQRLGDVIEAADLLRDHEEIIFLLVGEGASRRDLIAEAERRQLTNVRFLPYQAKSRLSASISAADLHLVPLDPRVTPYLMPSKLYGVLASGTPVLAVAESECDLSQIVRDTQSGVVCPPGSPQVLADAILECAADKGLLLEMGHRARRLAEDVYDRPLATSRFATVLKELVGNESASADTSLPSSVPHSAEEPDPRRELMAAGS